MDGSRLVGWLTNWTGFHPEPWNSSDTPQMFGRGFYDFYSPPDFKKPVYVNPRDAGGTVTLVLNCATFRYGTLGDQGNLERGGTYSVPRELGVAIMQMRAGTLS